MEKEKPVMGCRTETEDEKKEGEGAGHKQQRYREANK